MNLSGDILFDALSESFVVKKYGHYSQVLSLQRPRLYSGWGREFEENCLYIAQGEQLPGNPIFREGAVVICIGSSMPEAALCHHRLHGVQLHLGGFPGHGHT